MGIFNEGQREVKEISIDGLFEDVEQDLKACEQHRCDLCSRKHEGVPYCALRLASDAAINIENRDVILNLFTD